MLIVGLNWAAVVLMTLRALPITQTRRTLRFGGFVRYLHGSRGLLLIVFDLFEVRIHHIFILR
jgi:hypothetical protein